MGYTISETRGGTGRRWIELKKRQKVLDEKMYNKNDEHHLHTAKKELERARNRNEKRERE